MIRAKNNHRRRHDGRFKKHALQWYTPWYPGGGGYMRQIPWYRIVVYA